MLQELPKYTQSVEKRKRFPLLHHDDEQPLYDGGGHDTV